MSIFILCFNEEVLLPLTIIHYKKHLPSFQIYIYDNYSTDNSVKIALNMGCKVIQFDSNNIIDHNITQYIRNNCWKIIDSGWIIMVDMDEWLYVTENELEFENLNGTTILSINGYNMIGESQTIDLIDINLNELHKYTEVFVKHICFLREKISDINYSWGAHEIFPVGEIKFSSNFYLFKHMNVLGLNYYINKLLNRFNRSLNMRELGFSCHYTNDINFITNQYNKWLSDAKII